MKKRGIDVVNSSDEITGTPLIWSIINSKNKVARLLLRLGADVHTAAFNDKSAYDWAELSKDSKTTSLLLAAMKMTPTTTITGRGKSSNKCWRVIPNFIKRFRDGTCNRNQKTLMDSTDVIHEAAMQRSSQQLKNLIGKTNRDVNLQNQNGETPLHTAIKSQRTSTSKFLLTNGANVNAQNLDGVTPLHWAVSNNGSRKFDEIVKNMVMAGADLSVQNTQGNSPLGLIFLNNDIRTAKIICKALPEDSSSILEVFKLTIDYESIDVMRLLLKRWPSGIRDSQNNTLLHIAVLQEKYEIIDEIVDNIDVNLTNDDGETALHLAVEMKSNEIVCRLLHNNVDVNIKNLQGDTALHTAIQSNLQIFILLVEKCDKTIQNNDGDTAFHLASRFGKTEFVNLMICENKPNSDPYSSNYDVRSFELKDLQNNRQYTALHYACAENNHKIVEKLLEIEVNTELRNCDDKTALDIAIEMNHLCLVSLFKSDKLCGNSLVNFACRICIEIPLQLSFVYHCENGHIYCSTCDEKQKVIKCTDCAVPIRRRRRHRELESKLAIMFPNVELEGRVDSFECLFKSD